MNILYLSYIPGLQGPLPKIDPLLISFFRNSGLKVTKHTWGRHSENESFGQKIFGRLMDLIHALLMLIRKRYDILYVVTTLDERALARDIPLLLATYWFPVKKVLIMHGSKTEPLFEKGHLSYKLFTRAVIRLSNAILLLSSEEMETWKKFESRGRYYRVDNPFVPQSNTPSNKLTGIGKKIYSNPILIFTGRLIKAKGIIDLLHAMPKILGEVDCHLLIAGTGKEKEEINCIIKKGKLEQSVSVLGYVDSNQLSGFYGSATLFVLPTYFYEGFPTVIAEAMSYGLPIITTPIRGARDHLIDGTNALFIQPRDPELIAKAVVRLLKDPELRSKMRQANLEKIREFRPEKVVPRYIQIFHELFGEDFVS